MINHKKRCALLLAIVMLLSVLPATPVLAAPASACRVAASMEEKEKADIQTVQNLANGDVAAGANNGENGDTPIAPYSAVGEDELIGTYIKWEHMDFTYVPGDWDTVTHSYDEGTWDTENKITVQNTGNVDITLRFDVHLNDIHLTGRTNYTGDALSPAESCEVLVSLFGDPSDKDTEFTNQDIGSVTVTISRAAGSAAPAAIV